VADYQTPDALRYSRDDEWVRVEGERLTIGVTDYAQKQLGDVVFVELPEVDKSFERGEPFGVIESVKAVADLFAPVSGQVLEVNGDLAEQPEAVNEGCYGDGWMIVFKVADVSELDQLLDAAAYARHCEERDAESA
jgi:glycine cleavage system H protein